MLDSSVHLRVDFGFHHMRFDLIHNLMDKFFPLRFAHGNLIHQIIVNLRLEVFQRQVVQFHLDFGNTQALGDGRVDVHRLPGFFFLLALRHVFQRPHVVQTVRQLDEDYPDILCHGQKHLPQIFRLYLQLIRGIIQLSQFGHAVHQKRHLRAEQLRQFLLRHHRILHHIMEDAGDDGFLVQFQIRQNDGHTQRMDNVRFSRFSYLAFVSLRCNLICFFYHMDAVGRVIVFHAGNQFPVQYLRAGEIFHGFHTFFHIVNTLDSLFRRLYAVFTHRNHPLSRPYLPS